MPWWLVAVGVKNKWVMVWIVQPEILLSVIEVTTNGERNTTTKSQELYIEICHKWFNNLLAGFESCSLTHIVFI